MSLHRSIFDFMKIISFFRKIGIDLFFYFLKGARIDAALMKQGRNRLRTMIDYPKPEAQPMERIGNRIVYNEEDILKGWQLITKAKLKLKNNSKNFAYNIELLNGEELFGENGKLKKLISLAPNESMEVDIDFLQYCHCVSGLEADNMPYLPVHIENKILNIKYENESGTKFITKFWMSFDSIINEYTYA